MMIPFGSTRLRQGRPREKAAAVRCGIRICRPLLLIGVVIGLASPFLAEGQSPAGGDMGAYDTVDVTAGEATFLFDGGIESLTGGAKITLKADDPNTKPLPISAVTIKFFYAAKGATKPSKIVLDQKVVVTHPQGTVHADKAEWDFEKGVLTFTGNPVMSAPQMKEMTAPTIILDFNEGRIKCEGGMRINGLQLGGTGDAATNQDPSLLREQDVLDWTKFLATIKEQSAAKAASPGKRIVNLLDPKMQGFLSSLPPEKLAAEKGSIVKQLNKVLASPTLYDAAAWSAVALSEELKATADKGGLSGQDATRLNRDLLNAAFPDLIAPRVATGQ